MAVRINSVNLDGNERFSKINLPMSPVLNCTPASPPSDNENLPKSVSTNSEPSPPEISLSPKPFSKLNGVENDRECPNSSPTNNNSIPLNCKKLTASLNENVYENPIRSSWNSSPIMKNTERDSSISPSSSGHQRNSASPSLSPEPTRILSQASSESHRSDNVDSPDNFSRSPKLSHGELSTPVDVPSTFDNRISPDNFKLANSFIQDPLNPYLRLNPLNPFQPPHNFLSNPFLASNDPKLLLSHGFGLISQQLHTVHQLSGKFHPQDLKDMTIQQLQFLQNRLQNLPPQTSPPFSKFPDVKNQLSLLMQARKNPKNSDSDSEKRSLKQNGDEVSNRLKYQEVSKLRDHKTKSIDDVLKNRKMSSDDGTDVNNYPEDSDSDELLSVGSESPPPNCQVTLFRRDTDNESDAGSSSLDCSFSKTNFQNSNKTVNASAFEKSKKLNRLQNNMTNNKSVNVNNRTLKFSIDNILKSDFGNEITIKKPSKPDNKKEKSDKDNDRTPVANSKDVKKSSDNEKELPVDLSQDNSTNSTGSDAPMLWPAWVYCTRYSDRPSSGRSPRTRRTKNKDKNPEEKRPRTAFSGDQLSRLKHEFAENRYLTERRRQDLARELGLNEAQIKIWFQNKRAKMKKARGEKNPLALQLMAQGLYNHSTVPLTREEEEAAAAELSD